MSAATFSFDQMLVRIYIRGEDAVENRARGALPCSTGVLNRFRWWCTEQEIYPVFSSSTGGGMHCAYYAPAEAEKIRAWLVEQGVVEVESLR